MTDLTADRASFGTLPDGREVARIDLARPGSVHATIISLGATLQALHLADRDGIPADICIGHDRLADYLARRDFFGVTVGRVANRIADGRFRIDGQEYQTPPNNGPNALHGGPDGFDTVLWDVVDVAGGATASVTLRYVSPAGEMGYPGRLTATATFTLDAQDQLTVEYQATTDAPTFVNITHHALWNLSGPAIPRSAMDHKLTIAANHYIPVDEAAIPTGVLASVAGTPFDFRESAAIGDRVRDGTDQQLCFGRGYDHNWAVTDAVAASPHLTARLADPPSGRGFELWSNQPGLQFYSGNFLDATVATKANTLLRQGDAIALEPQGFPDAPNQPAFPSVRLDPGETYRNVIIYKFASDFR